MNLPELGVGIVYVPGLEPLLEPGVDYVDVLEIEPQTLWRYKADEPAPYSFPQQTLQHLQTLPQAKIVHSVGFAVGGSQRPDKTFCEALINSITQLNAPWASEHLSFTQFQAGQQLAHAGFMLPSLQTAEGALTAARTISALASQLPVPFAVETTVNYLKPRAQEISDGEFVALTVETANCGILLDLHNIWTNERNGRQRVKDFLANIPLDRVWEIHLGGGFEYQGYWLDAHSGSVPPPVLDLAAELIPTLPHLKAVIYEIFPSFLPLYGIDAVGQQLETIRDLWQLRQAQAVRREYHEARLPLPVALHPDPESEIFPAVWETHLGELITQGESAGPLAMELKTDKAIALIQKLIWKFRAGAIIKSLSILTQLIRISCGEKMLEDLLDGYFNQSTPQPFASEEARGFIEYLRNRNLDILYLEDIIAYEEHATRALLDGKPQYIQFNYDPRILIQNLMEGRVPETLVEGSYELEVTP